MEEQDVADSWEEPEDQLSANVLGGEQPGHDSHHHQPGLLEALNKTPAGPARLQRETSMHYV